MKRLPVPALLLSILTSLSAVGTSEANPYSRTPLAQNSHPYETAGTRHGGIQAIESRLREGLETFSLRVQTRGDVLQIEIPEDKAFEPRSNVLTDHAKGALKVIYAALAADPQARLVVGVPGADPLLNQMRGLAVANTVQALGVAPNRLSILELYNPASKETSRIEAADPMYRSNKIQPSESSRLPDRRQSTYQYDSTAASQRAPYARGQQIAGRALGTGVVRAIGGHGDQAIDTATRIVKSGVGSMLNNAVTSTINEAIWSMGR